MAEQIDKATYKGIVKFTLESMKELATTDKLYSLQMDLAHYYETAIKREAILTREEFLEICKEVGVQ